MSETNDTQRKSALVTGSSRGIGLAVASELAQAGYNVCLNCSSERGLAALQEHADELAAQYGVQTLAVAASVGNADEASALVSAAHKAFGRLDVLVNNAGITHDADGAHEGGRLRQRHQREPQRHVFVLQGRGPDHDEAALWAHHQHEQHLGIGGNAGQVNYAPRRPASSG